MTHDLVLSTTMNAVIGLACQRVADVYMFVGPTIYETSA